jgi:cytochrome c
MADSLTFNKIAGAALATGLVIFGLQDLTSIVFEQAPPAKPGYAIAVQEAAGGGEAADVIPDWGTALPKADLAKGQAITSKCASCHQFDPADTPNIGPGLFGVVGRAPASQAKYTTYDAAMQDFAKGHPTWTYDLLYQFLKNPQVFMPGTKMTFIGLKDPQDRIDVIDYLRSNGSSSVPIPPPAPAKAAAAPAPGATNATAAATNSAAPTNAAATNAASATKAAPTSAAATNSAATNAAVAAK